MATRIAAIALLALVLIGCDRKVMIEPVDAGEDTAMVEEAAAMLGLSVIWGYGPTSLSLHLTDGCETGGLQEGECGLAMETPLLRCHGLWAIANRDVPTIAHELGHSLGLPHGAGIMTELMSDAELPTERQLERVARRAKACWGNK